MKYEIKFPKSCLRGVCKKIRQKLNIPTLDFFQQDKNWWEEEKAEKIGKDTFQLFLGRIYKVGAR